MYAVIRSGGKQYKVSQGEKIRLGLLGADTGATVGFDVLAVHDGKTLTVGTPLVESAKVTGKILSKGRGRKIIVFRFKRRKGFHKKKGHRQDYAEVLIENVELAGASLAAGKQSAEQAGGAAKEGDPEHGA